MITNYNLNTNTTTARDNILKLKELKQSLGNNCSLPGTINSSDEIYSDEFPSGVTVTSSERILHPISISDEGIEIACNKKGIVKGRYSEEEASEMINTPKEFTNNNLIEGISDLTTLNSNNQRAFGNLQSLDLHGDETLKGNISLQYLSNLTSVDVSKIENNCNLTNIPTHVASIKEGNPTEITLSSIDLEYSNVKLLESSYTRKYYNPAGQETYLGIPCTSVHQCEKYGIISNNYRIDDATDITSLNLQDVRGNWIDLVNAIGIIQKLKLYIPKDITELTLTYKAISPSTHLPAGDPLTKTINSVSLETPIQLGDLKIVKYWPALLLDTFSGYLRDVHSIGFSGLDVIFAGQNDSDSSDDDSEVMLIPIPYKEFKDLLYKYNDDSFTDLLEDMGFSSSDINYMENSIVNDTDSTLKTVGMFWTDGEDIVPFAQYSDETVSLSSELTAEDPSPKKVYCLYLVVPKVNLNKIAGICGGCYAVQSWV